MTYLVMCRATPANQPPGNWRQATGRHFSTNGASDDVATDAAAWIAAKNEQGKAVEYSAVELPT